MASDYRLRFTKRSKKDAAKIKQYSALDKKTDALLNLLEENPFQNPPSYEKLGQNLNGHYSRRINKQHRLVYAVNKADKIVKILSLWTHYE